MPNTGLFLQLCHYICVEHLGVTSERVSEHPVLLLYLFSVFMICSLICGITALNCSAGCLGDCSAGSLNKQL